MDQDISVAQNTLDIPVTANGQRYTFSTGSTVATLLDSLNVTAKYVVVQMNDNIIPRSEYASTILQPDCKLEVVTMVGGG
jgi:thiamine biosynthesis protein ThiS